jgi:RNA polymerase sigma factor (sigma-70 family)
MSGDESMPIRMKPVEFDGDGGGKYKDVGGFKYDIVKKSTVHTYEEFPKHFLGNTVEEAEKLYHEFSKTLNAMAGKYAAVSGLEKADLFGEALVGLARARRDFDPTRSEKFKIFALYKIKDALEEYTRNFSTPVFLPAYLKKAQRIMYRLVGLLHSTGVSKETTQAVLAGDIDKIPKEVYDQCLGLLIYLTRAAERANILLPELISRIENLPQGSTDIETIETDDRFQEKIDAKIIVDGLKSHMTKEELTIAELIMEGKTFEEIGRRFDRTDAWVAQQLDKMRTRLKKTIKM